MLNLKKSLNETFQVELLVFLTYEKYVIYSICFSFQKQPIFHLSQGTEIFQCHLSSYIITQEL